jgi:hypothetical protein
MLYDLPLEFSANALVDDLLKKLLYPLRNAMSSEVCVTGQTWVNGDVGEIRSTNEKVRHKRSIEIYLEFMVNNVL